MDEVKRGNFEFVEEIYPEIYKRISKAESLANLNCNEAGSILRKVFERWLTTLVKEFNIQATQGNNFLGTLNDKRKALKQAHKLPTINNGTRSAFDFKNTSGQNVPYPAYIGWQKFGNECHHDDMEPDNSASNAPDPDAPAATYENLMTVFKIVYKVFKAEYKRKKGAQAAAGIRAFDPYIMPIGENYVIKSYIPIDAPMSDCIREYETCSYNDNGRVNKYGIVRVFRKKSMDEIMLQLRDKEAFSEVEQEAGIHFDGNVQIDVLSRMKEENDFYVVIYKFSSKPSRLNKTILEQMSMTERLVLCKQIAGILYNFHNLDVPIYLRNLSFDSIYICKNKKGKYESSIIKLDCTKISSQEGTVVLNVENIHNLIQEEKLLKYLSPQTIRFIETINEIRIRNEGSMKDDETEGSIKIMSDRADWASADIYSLGVLFGDILSGQIEPSIASVVKLRSAGVDDRMGQLVMKMTDENPGCRPNLDVVIQSLEETE